MSEGAGTAPRPSGRRIRVAVVGAGIAGVTLAWRLADAPRRVAVDLYAGGHGCGEVPVADATAVSGGLVRAVEPDPAAAEVAARSLAELLGSSLLRNWAGFREVGSLYILPTTTDLASVLGPVQRHLPGSARIARAERVSDWYPLKAPPPGSVAVLERRAGYIRPDGLRNALLHALAPSKVTVKWDQLSALAATPAVHLFNGRQLRYDAVIIAAGPWTPRLLAASELPVGELRTKQIQYTSCVFTQASGAKRTLPAFVDGISGLYGRPTGDGRLLLGLPNNCWDVQPQQVRPDIDLSSRTLAVAAESLALEIKQGGPPLHTFAAADCYHDPPGLALRRVSSSCPVYTFTGGSGGAAKTALAASRAAASALLDDLGI